MSTALAHVCRVPRCRVAVDAGAVTIELPLPRRLWSELCGADVAGEGMSVGLGRTALGERVAVDLSSPGTPHVGVYGATGSGKSELMRAMVWSLAAQNEPAALGLVLIDGKARELTSFDGLAHLCHPVVVRPAQFGPVLEALEREVTKRIADPVRCARRLVVAIDEVADVLRVTGGVAGAGGDALHRIASLGRGLGVHLIVGTHHPTADVLGRLVSASVRLRICGVVADDAASRLVMGMNGSDGEQARTLAGCGDMLCVLGDSVVRFQGPLVTSDELERLPRVADVPRLELPEPAAVVHPSQVPKDITPSELAAVLAESLRLGRAPGIKRVESIVRQLDGECSATRAKRVRGATERLVEEMRQRGLRVAPSGVSGGEGS